MTSDFSHIFKPYVTMCVAAITPAIYKTNEIILQLPQKEPANPSYLLVRGKNSLPLSTGLIIPCPKSALKDLIFANSRN